MGLGGLGRGAIFPPHDGSNAAPGPSHGSLAPHDGSNAAPGPSQGSPQDGSLAAPGPSHGFGGKYSSIGFSTALGGAGGGGRATGALKLKQCCENIKSITKRFKLKTSKLISIINFCFPNENIFKCCKKGNE